MKLVISNENYLKVDGLKKDGILKIGHVGSKNMYIFTKTKESQGSSHFQKDIIEITVSGSNFKSLTNENEISIVSRNFSEAIYFKKCSSN